MSKRNIVHVEFPSRNFEESGDFYSRLFGWKITLMPEMNYALWEAETEPGGGFNPLSERVKVGDVLVYVASDDIEADLQKVVELGGEVVAPKTEIPEIGWFGIFKDPTGNMCAVYTSINPE